jgi:hypothetical protein
MMICHRAPRSAFRVGSNKLRGWSLVLALSALSPLYAHPARAQDDSMVAVARERFQEGVKYYDAKQYEKARAAFLQAYALKRHPAVLLNLAQSELRSAHEVDAAKHFDLYLRDNKEASALERQEAEKGLSAAKARVGQIDVRVEDGADISVDGQPEGRSPLPGPVYVSPGNHTLEARKAGQTANTQVDAAAGRATTATLTLGAGGGGAAPAPASDTAAGAPPGGAAPAPEADQGTESAEFDTQGGREPFFRWFAHNKVAWIGGGLTLVGIGGAVGFSLASKSHYDAANDYAEQIRQQATQQSIPSPCAAPTGEFVLACKKFSDEEDQGDKFKVLTFVSIGVAVVAAGGTIAYYFIDSKKKTEARAPLLVPVIAPKTAGLTLQGQF